MRDFLVASDDAGVGYKVIVDGEQVGEDEIVRPLSRSMSITPVINGAGALGKILAGIALVALALTGIGMVVGTAIATAMFTIGASLILGGIAQLLAPTPKNGTAADKNENAYFNGAENVTTQGLPVPFGYGRLIVGSRVVSAGITVEDQYSNGSAYMGGFPGDRRFSLA